MGVAGAAAANKGRASMQIGFELGSSKVMERDIPKLERLAQALGNESLQATRYLVVGHTDASGPLALNIVCLDSARNLLPPTWFPSASMLGD